MTQTTEELMAEAKNYTSEIAQIKRLFSLVAAKGDIHPSLTHAANASVKNGYIVWLPRAKRYKFTEKGARFHKQMRKFARRI